MNFKQIITIVLVATALFASFGCGGGGKQSSSSSSASNSSGEKEKEAREQILQEQDEIKKIIKQGNAYQNQGDHILAIAEYTQAIEHGIEIINAAESSYEILFGLEYKEAVIGVTQRIISDAYYNRGNSYLNQNNYENALVDFNKFIEDHLKHGIDKRRLAFAYRDRGSCYANLGDYGRAIADYSRSIEKYPIEATAYRNRGLVYQRIGKTEKAEADFAKAREWEIKK